MLAGLLGAACSRSPSAAMLDAAAPRADVRTCTADGVAGPARCATVSVAESSAPNARRIDLRVIVLPSRSATPARDAVLPLAGGPGQGTAEIAGFYARRFGSLRDERDIILVDQRGTGQSNGLHCPPAAATADLMGKLFDPARLATCRDELSRRADLTQYTTAAAAADFERVVDALGYPQVNVIGGSYGTRLGLEIARRMPTRVRTLTLEGVAPVGFDWPSHAATDADAALDGLIRECEADRECMRAFPTFRQDVDRSFAVLREHPVSLDVRDLATDATARVTFSVSDLGYATRGVLYGDEALWLPLWFRQAAGGDYGAFAQAYVNRARRLEPDIADGVHLGVYCAEDLPYVDWPRARAAAERTRLGTYLLDQYRGACDVWPRAAVTSAFRDPVRSAVPTLLMSGRLDPVTPPRTAEEAARTLSLSRVLVWPHGAHGNDGSADRSCRAGILRQFLRTTDPRSLHVDCVAAATRLPFRLP